MKKALLMVIVFFSLFSSGFAFSNGTLDVGVKPAEPFIIVSEEGDVSGFSVDLITLIAQELNSSPEINFTVDPTLSEHLINVGNGEFDLGIAATTITAEREEYMDFSHPFYESSLAIMLKEGTNKKDIWGFLVEEGILELLGYTLFGIFLLANIIYFVERNKRFKAKNYFTGISSAIWWTTITLMPTTEAIEYNALNPRSRISKLLSQAIVLIGVLVFGIIFAKMASVFTVYELQSSVEGPSDLFGKQVGVIAGTQTVNVAKEYGLTIKEVNNVSHGVQLLDSEEIDAFIHDKPILQYYLRTRGEGKFYLVQQTFYPHFYGITFAVNATIREEINIALLEIKESGRYRNLKQFWFGDSY